MSKHLFQAVGAAAIVLIASIPIANGQTHQSLTDPEIQKLVEHKLADEDIRGVKVQVKDGTVTLNGAVSSLWLRDEAMEEAAEVADVQQVINNLTIPRGESDKALAEEIAADVRRSVFYTIFDDVDVAVEDGIVTLSGRVTMPYKAEEMATLASRVSHVQAVRNALQTLPVSIADDQLRVVIARAIYREPLFWNYAIQAQPPIHVIVENGRVTLTGMVASEVERGAAESIARSRFGVFGVENKLRVEQRN